MKLIALLTLILLTSCASLEESIGVGPDDNAILCIRADAHLNHAISTGNIDGIRIEFPAWFNDENTTIEQLIALIDAMGCP